MNSVLVTYPYEKAFEGKRENDMRRRWQTRNTTLKLLADIGIRPFVSMSEPGPSHANNRRNGIRALKATTGAVLYFEDDIIPTRNLLDWMPTLEAQEHVTLLCSYRPGDLPEWVGEAVRNLTPIRPQVVPVAGHWSGAQALYIPETIADEIRADAHAFTPSVKFGPFDTYVRNKFRRASCVIPNPVQHASPPSLVRKRQDRISQTFAHPVKET